MAKKRILLLGSTGSVGESTDFIDQGDLFRTCMDAVLEWKDTLPSAVTSSKYLSTQAREFEKALQSPDPVSLFIETLPRIAGRPKYQTNKILDEVRKLKSELEGIQTLFIIMFILNIIFFFNKNFSRCFL